MVGTLRPVLVIDFAYWVVALVLVVAGVGKLVDPRRTAEAIRRLGLPAPGVSARLVGLWEVLVGGAALLAPAGGVASIVALLVAVSYCALALVVVAAMRRGLDDCGCIGVGASAPSVAHVVLDAGSALAAFAAAWFGPVDLVAGLGDAGAPWSVLLGLGVAVAAGAVVALPGRSPGG